MLIARQFLRINLLSKEETFHGHTNGVKKRKDYENGNGESKNLDKLLFCIVLLPGNPMPHAYL